MEIIRTDSIDDIYLCPECHQMMELIVDVPLEEQLVVAILLICRRDHDGDGKQVLASVYRNMKLNYHLEMKNND